VSGVELNDRAKVSPMGPTPLPSLINIQFMDTMYVYKPNTFLKGLKNYAKIKEKHNGGYYLERQ